MANTWPSTVNDSARAMMAAIAVWRDLIDYGTVSGGTVGGTGNAVTLTCSPTVTAREAGRRYLFKAGAGNTGGVTLTVDSTAAGAIQYRGAALASGDIATNDWILVADDATNFQLITPPRVSLLSVAATQAQMETATSVIVPVTPGRVQYHPGVAKFWLKATANSTTVEASHNVTGVADTGTGVMTVTIATDFSGVDWCCIVGVEHDGAASAQSGNVELGGQAAGTVAMECRNSGGGVDDPTAWHCVGYGDQA